MVMEDGESVVLVMVGDAVASPVVDRRRQFDEITAEMELLANSYVQIGFQDGDVTRSEVKGTRRKQAGLSQAQIAAENEFGTRRIPARPFMSTSFDENRTRIVSAVNGQYNRILSGQSDVRKSLNILGLFMVDLIQQKILAIHTPPNSPRTIARKGSSKPLIDFGQMFASVRHVVVIR